MQIDKNTLKDALKEIFDELPRIDANIHAIHHEWIKEQIEKEHNKQEMMKEITKIIMNWTIPGVLAYIVYKIRDILAFFGVHIWW